MVNSKMRLVLENTIALSAAYVVTATPPSFLILVSSSANVQSLKRHKSC